MNNWSKIIFIRMLLQLMKKKKTTEVFFLKQELLYLLQVEGTAIGFMSVCTDVNVELLNECFELGPFHGLHKPHPEDEVEPPQSPSPSFHTTPKLGTSQTIPPYNFVFVIYEVTFVF